MEITNEMAEAIRSEIKTYHFAEKNHPSLPIIRVKDCGCMGPMPECKCAKRARLVKEFLDMSALGLGG